MPHTSLGYRLAQRLVLSKVHQALGLDRAWVNGYAIGKPAKIIDISNREKQNTPQQAARLFPLRLFATSFH